MEVTIEKGVETPVPLRDVLTRLAEALERHKTSLRLIERSRRLRKLDTSRLGAIIRGLDGRAAS
jgi:hypothetical protein